VEDYYVEFWRLWIKALHETQPHLLAYLIYMVLRLLHMKAILKPTGSIYLHCDPTASHYIKVMMDGIFGHQNFVNEIIWVRSLPHGNVAKKYGASHDVILFYRLGGGGTWNRPYQPHREEYLKQFYRYKEPDGRVYRLISCINPNPNRPNLTYNWNGVTKVWKYTRDRMQRMHDEGLLVYSKNGIPQYKGYLDLMQGTPVQDVWTDIPPLMGSDPERMGYPTQKPKALLRRIIEASSKKGDVVFDPFCGCGTTIYAAQELGRQWIGCDVAILAVRLVEDQLGDRYGLIKGEHYEEHGIPNSVASAKALFDQSPIQFEHWAVEYVGAFPTKVSGDKGIDGRLYFELGKDLGSMVFSVKGGGIRPTDIRDLRGVLADDDSAQLAGFISLREPTRGMLNAAAEAGTWEYQGNIYPRVQIRTVRDLVEDKRQFQSPTKLRTRAQGEQTHLALG
jgi:DNA modification methylase